MSSAVAPIGIYRAQVVSNQDPLNSGRVQVNIFGLSGVQNITAWARPASSFGYLPGSQGSFIVPANGAQVYVFFENGDSSLPVYFAGVVLNNQTLSTAKIDGAPSQEYVLYQSPHGNVIRLSDNKNKIVINTSAGATLTIDDSASTITIQNAGKININGANQINLQSKNITGTASNGITLKAAKISLN